jgi:hypothetical protein
LRKRVTALIPNRNSRALLKTIISEPISLVPVSGRYPTGQVAVAVIAGKGVAVGVAVGEGVAVGVAVGEGVAVGVAVGKDVAVGDKVGKEAVPEPGVEVGVTSSSPSSSLSPPSSSVADTVGVEVESPGEVALGEGLEDGEAEAVGAGPEAIFKRAVSPQVS